MKKLSLLAVLALFATPSLVLAGDRDRGRDHRHMGASEFAGVGVLAAAAIGLAGYLALRQRSAKQN